MRCRNILVLRRICCRVLLARGRVLVDRVVPCTVVVRIAARIVARIVTKTTLSAKLAYALLEEAAANDACGGTTGTAVRGHLVGIRVVSGRLHVPISAIISLATGAILEISKTNA